MEIKLTKEEVEQIGRDAATYLGKQFIDYGDLNEQAEKQITDAWVSCATVERLKAKEREAELTSTIIQYRKDMVSLSERIKELEATFRPVQLCPKCWGTGVISRPPGVPFDQAQWSSSATSFVCDICHGAKTV